MSGERFPTSGEVASVTNDRCQLRSDLLAGWIWANSKIAPYYNYIGRDLLENSLRLIKVADLAQLSHYKTW